MTYIAKVYNSRANRISLKLKTNDFKLIACNQIQIYYLKKIKTKLGFIPHNNQKTNHIPIRIFGIVHNIYKCFIHFFLNSSKIVTTKILFNTLS